MKRLDLFQLRGMSRSVLDDYMVENGYKILDVDFNENTPNLSDITYRKEGVLDLKIKISYCNNIVWKFTFC